VLKKLLIAAALLGIIIYAISEATPGSAAYFAQLQKDRRAKNTGFRNSPDSPLTVSQRPQFDSLKYYAPDPQWVVAASLSRNARPDTVLLPMSDNKEEQYLRWGQAHFTLNGKQQLTLFRKASGTDSTLFVPFTDLSNGHGSYGGGRYLDLPIPTVDAETVELDFNRAYNPYCAYNDDYSCPVPPAENRLRIAIPAGEQSFHD
jgi:uncharacterized protein (DUF1684 family)